MRTTLLLACLATACAVSPSSRPCPASDVPNAVRRESDASSPDGDNREPDVVAVTDAPMIDTSTLDVNATDATDATDATGVFADCPARQRCGTTCVDDYSTDPAHCGACWIACAPRGPGAVPACSGGLCVIGCRAGLVPCGVSACVDPRAPAFDCATCGFTCPDGQRCHYDGRRGVCVPR